MRFSKKIALISGGNGAFGTAIARRFTSEGGTVILSDITKPDPAAIKSAFAGTTAPDFIHLDVTSEDGWAKAIAEVIAKHGQLDILVNNAGVVSEEVYPFDEMKLDEWRRVYTINVEGTLLGMQAAMREMKKRKTGNIVNIGSIAGYIGSKDGAAYGASKGAVKILSKQAALSAAKFGYGIRINTVHPAYVWTPLVSKKLVRIYGSEENARNTLTASIPLGMLPEPVDIASAVAFLASDDARLITGADLVIDGGRLIQ